MYKIRMGVPEMKEFWEIEPHPEDKKRGAYRGIKLSELPK